MYICLSLRLRDIADGQIYLILWLISSKRELWGQNYIMPTRSNRAIVKILEVTRTGVAMEHVSAETNPRNIRSATWFYRGDILKIICATVQLPGYELGSGGIELRRSLQMD